MPRNVEIKARARDFKGQVLLAERLENRGVLHVIQEDTFFNVVSGRLKLRTFADGSGELIQYQRVDSLDPAEPHYIRYPTDTPELLKEALTNALGVRGLVRKKRTVYLTGKKRIHMDEVEGLGSFIELEVVLESTDEIASGVALARELMSKLSIEEEDLVEGAYIDMLDDNPYNDATDSERESLA